MQTINALATPPLDQKRPLSTLGGRKVPTKSFKCLWHVGSLRIADKGIQGASQEGSGLSISLHPDDWASIARLGGNPTWALRRPENKFLNFHKLNSAQREALQAWGIGKGYLALKAQWELKYFDSELDDDCYCRFDSESEARQEIPDWLEEPDMATITPVVVPCPTPAMAARLGFDTKFCDAMDMTATFWVEDETSLDGVWWQDTYEPQLLSAPRGVIVKRALQSWTVTR
jgi:hypothetical protein